MQGCGQSFCGHSVMRIKMMKTRKNIGSFEYFGQKTVRCCSFAGGNIWPFCD